MDALKQLGRLATTCLMTGSLFLSSAWAFTPTQAQIEQFKNLPAAQQKQLAKSYGVDISALTGKSSSANTIQQPAEEPLKPRQAAAVDANIPQPVDEQVTETQLKRFGYDLFAASPTTFAQVANVPVPSNYTLGPGDTLKVQLFGKTSDQFALQIDRDGNVDFPELGPISLAGQSFSEARQTLTTRVKEQIIGVRISVTMGELRSIQVFVLGDAFTPGLYTISALSNISHALYQSGGIAKTGSLRSIQLKRSGQLVAELDLYDLLLKGDTSNDARLLPGDVVFIPPSKGAVAVDGEVRRPAIYELKKGETVADAITMAGGLLPDAYPKKSLLTGYDEQKIKQVTTLDLTQSQDLNLPLTSGDYIEVRSAKESVENGVLMMGAVAHPGYYAWKAGMRVSDLLPSVEAGLLPGTDLNYALIITEHVQQSRISVRQLDLAKTLSQPGTAADPILSNRDSLLLFNRLGVVKEQENSRAETLLRLHSATPAQRRDILEQAKYFSRSELLQPVIRRLKAQAMPGEFAKLVSVTGSVKDPGEYPLIEGARLTDLIAAAGGMTESADMTKAEISRTTIDDHNQAQIQYVASHIGKAYRDPAHNPELKAKDIVNVMRVPGWQDNPVITIKGEVKYPGTYTIKRGETVMDVLARVGGFTPFANTNGVIFTRASIRQQQQQQLSQLGQQLRKQLASLSLRANKGANSSLADYDTMQKLIADLSAAEPVGRLVIDMPEILAGNLHYNLQLEDGDALYVPPRRSSVSVIGEVQLEGTHYYTQDLDLSDYLDRSGGMKAQADDDRIYIVKASGDVVIPGSGFLFFKPSVTLEPGDTVVVPLNVEYMDGLTLWSTATGILYNTAVAVAAIGSL